MDRQTHRPATTAGLLLAVLAGCGDADPLAPPAPALEPAYDISIDPLVNERLNTQIQAFYNYNNAQFGYYDSGQYVPVLYEATQSFASDGNIYLNEIWFTGAGAVTATEALGHLDDYITHVNRGLQRGDVSPCAAAMLTFHALEFKAIITAVDGGAVTWERSPFEWCPEVVAITMTPAETTPALWDPVTITASPEREVGGWTRFHDEEPARAVSFDWAVSPAGAGTVAPLPGDDGTEATVVFTPATQGDIVVTARERGGDPAITGSTLIHHGQTTITAITLSSNDVTLSLGGTVQLAAVATDAAGVVWPVDLEWTSADVGVASVEDGLITGEGGGTTQVTVTYGDASASVNVLVRTDGVTRVEVSPSSYVLPVGAGVTLSATAYAIPEGESQEQPDGSRVVTWSASPAGIVSVDGSGNVTAVTPGNATVTANSEGHSAAAAITVTPALLTGVEIREPRIFVAPGGTYQIIARGLVGNQRVSLADRAATWTSADVAIAEVVEGVVLGVVHGAMTEARVAAHDVYPLTAPPSGYPQTFEDAADIYVRHPLQGGSLALAEDIELLVGESTQIVSAWTDVTGAVVDQSNPVLTEGRELRNWASADASVVAVDQDGLVTIVEELTEPVAITVELVDRIRDDIAVIFPIQLVVAACEFPGKGKGVKQAVEDRFCAIHPDGPGKSADRGKGNAGG